ncbi:MAG: hypothetical protein B6I25_06855 [Planctomycetales bacterium 4572_13]|nr:MAG: hypothetical protein B6I25_06855 [Planctomycetales bacterium 4572_13]
MLSFSISICIFKYLLPARMVAIEEVLEIIELWLNTKFEGGRHQARIDMLDSINV